MIIIYFYFYMFSVLRACESEHSAAKCEVGDLANKLGPLAVAGRRRELAGTRRFFTDANLPLAGPAAIMGHSIVIHDDNAPEHRGNRMACAAIRRLYRHKAMLSAFFDPPSSLYFLFLILLVLTSQSSVLTCSTSCTEDFSVIFIAIAQLRVS
jgi:hypothetical protein